FSSLHPREPLFFLSVSGDLGGICSKHRKFQDKELSLNTGLITLQTYGQYLPPRLLHITLAHELGHSLGAPHDETEACARFSFDTTYGNYLMFSRATDGQQYNNDKFSPCSIEHIGNILSTKKDRCFVGKTHSPCLQSALILQITHWFFAQSEASSYSREQFIIKG
uniref:Peptidase M12B domain-containing protein n=1 Tax=Pelodiscus sinensis TaxID=13735 RepID=K7FQJ4_PELSI